MLPENCAAVYARVVARRTVSGLPAWSVQLIDELETSDRRATDLARGLSPEQLNWKPAEGVWSVGQCLHHLYVTNSTTTEVTAIDSFRIATAWSADPIRNSANIMAVGPHAVNPARAS